MLERAAGLAVAQHAREFRGAGFTVAVKRRDAHDRALAGLILPHDEMGSRLRRHLRQMGYTQHLVTRGDLREVSAHDTADFATHIGVDFVEHQQRHGIEGRQHRLEREHHPGEFTAGGDACQRERRLAGVRREEEFHRAIPRRAGLGQSRHANAEVSPGETQPPDCGRGCFLQGFRGLFAGRAQGLGLFSNLGQRRLGGLLQPRQRAVQIP